MRNAVLEEAQVGIKIARRNMNNLKYADDTTLMAESEEELKSLLMKVKEESEKAGFQFSSFQSLGRVRLCNPMNHSTPGLPVHHRLLSSLRLTSIESVMPSSHLILSSPSPLAPNPSQHQSLFQ